MSFLNSLLTKITGTPAHGGRAVGADADWGRSALCLGDADSAMNLTELEMLHDAVAAHPDLLCGIVIGLPLPAVERVLAAAGFDVAGRLHTFDAARRLHCFMEEDGTPWHLTDGELAGREERTTLRGGSVLVPDETMHFADWRRMETGRYRRFADGEERPLPKRLIYGGPTEAEPGVAYDCLASAASPEELLGRLRTMEVLGLNAGRYLTHLLQLVYAQGEAPTIPYLYRLLSDEESLRELLSRMVLADATIPEETLAVIHAPPPPQSLKLLGALNEFVSNAARTVSAREMLRPGEIWHIDTSTPVGACVARSVKEAVQRELLADGGAPGMHLLILSTDWSRLGTPELDEQCLPLPNCQLVYGVPNASEFMGKQNAKMTTLMAHFPSQVWHRCHDPRAQELIRKIAPEAGADLARLADMAWGKRLHTAGGKVMEVLIRDTCDHAAYREFNDRHPLAGSGDVARDWS